MRKFGMIVLLFLLGVGSGEKAWADWGHHDHYDVVVEPYWETRYLRQYAYPPVIIERPVSVVTIDPPVTRVFVEQPAKPNLPTSGGDHWYYCAASKKYYPFVKKCSAGWQKIPQKPPGEP